MLDFLRIPRSPMPQQWALSQGDQRQRADPEARQAVKL